MRNPEGEVLDSSSDGTPLSYLHGASNIVPGLESQLTGYTGFLAGESIVTSGSTYYGSTEQKVGVLYKSSIATLVSAKIILTAYDSDLVSVGVKSV